MTVTWLTGDIRDRLAEIPDGSISLVASSPPFLALRSYLPAGHASKHAEIGSETNPAAFLDTLLALTAEWGRVLAPWGSIAIELGDSYSGTGGAGGDWSDSPATTKARVAGGSGGGPPRRAGLTGWPAAKSLALIPQLYAIALAYGINPLTGAPSPAGRWLVRNVIVWHRPNPAVGALGDKYRPSTSYIVVATRSPRRWFDLDAVRHEPKFAEHTAKYSKPGGGYPSTKREGGLPERGDKGAGNFPGHEAGSPPLDTWTDHHDTWTITTQPSRLAHYAMWPPKLAERLILSMCPEQVCSQCGEPRRRMTSATYTAHGDVARQHAEQKASAVYALQQRTQNAQGMANGRATKHIDTLGWSDCGHDNYRPGTVLDPFAGTGTTLAVAHLHHRNATGIDLDPRNHNLYPARLDECRRALFGTMPEMPGQLSLLDEVIG